MDFEKLVILQNCKDRIKVKEDAEKYADEWLEFYKNHYPYSDNYLSEFIRHFINRLSELRACLEDDG